MQPPAWTRAIALRLRSLCTLDRRALAVFRVGLALLVLADLAHRCLDFREHYTDFGLLPRGALLSRFTNPATFCLHAAFGSAWGTSVLFLLHALFAVGLLLGYRTKLCTVACWALMVSLHVRNPMVLQGGDDLLRMLLFWAMFVPLGASHAMDAALAAAAASQHQDKSAAAASQGVCNVGTVALLVQLILLYASCAALKTGPEWWPEGSAVYYALHYDQLALPTAHLLRSHYRLTVCLTYVTLVLESVGWLAFCSPWWMGPLRTGAIVAFMGMHAAFGLCLMLGLFPFIDAVALLPLLPAWFFHHLARLGATSKVHQLQRQTTIYFDRERPACRVGCFVLREALGLRYVCIATIERLPQIQGPTPAQSAWMVLQAGRPVMGWGALVALCRASVWARMLIGPLSAPRAQRFGAWLYRRMSNQRGACYRFLPAVSHRVAKRSPVGALAGAVALLLVVSWNLCNVPAAHLHFPDPLRPVMLALRLDQNWGMFAPSPAKVDGWLVVEGTLDNGQHVDVLRPHNRPVRYTKPKSVAAQYGNQRRSKYFMNIWMARHVDYRLYYGQYLCRFYNGTDQPRTPYSLQKFTINVMQEVMQQGYQKTAPEKISIWQHYCFDAPKV